MLFSCIPEHVYPATTEHQQSALYNNIATTTAALWKYNINVAATRWTAVVIHIHGYSHGPWTTVNQRTSGRWASIAKGVWTRGGVYGGGGKRLAKSLKTWSQGWCTATAVCIIVNNTLEHPGALTHFASGIQRVHKIHLDENHWVGRQVGTYHTRHTVLYMNITWA